jgi:hypothetical protein
MITQQLLDYIRSQQAAGKSMEEIKTQLHASGWQESDINEGLAAVSSGQATAPAGPVGELPGATEILKEAWHLYTGRFWLFVSLSAVPILGFLILGIIFTMSGLVYYKPGITTTNNAVGGSIMLVIALVALIALIYISVWAAASLLVVIRDRSETLTFGETMRRGRPYINPFFTTGLLAGLAVIGGVILLIIPGIIFWLWFSQSTYITVGENLVNQEALSQSKSYVKGRMGSVFLKLIFIVFITWVITIIVSLPFGFSKESSMVGNIITQIVNILWAPVTAIYGYMLYEHLKRTKSN